MTDKDKDQLELVVAAAVAWVRRVIVCSVAGLARTTIAACALDPRVRAQRLPWTSLARTSTHSSASLASGLLCAYPSNKYLIDGKKKDYVNILQGQDDFRWKQRTQRGLGVSRGMYG